MSLQSELEDIATRYKLPFLILISPHNLGLELRTIASTEYEIAAIMCRAVATEIDAALPGAMHKAVLASEAHDLEAKRQAEAN